MTIQRKTLPKVQPKRLREARAAKKPQGFPASVKEIIHTRSKGVCELDACGPAQVIHHRRPRGAGGTSLPWVNRAANGLHLADACHLRIESNRMKAYVNGWLVALNGPAVSADVPVLHRGRWVLLRDDGSVTPIQGDCWDEPEVLA